MSAYRPGTLQAQCPTCGAWTSIRPAGYRSPRGTDILSHHKRTVPVGNGSEARVKCEASGSEVTIA